jgi:hypothetical protein
MAELLDEAGLEDSHDLPSRAYRKVEEMMAAMYTNHFHPVR